MHGVIQKPDQRPTEVARFFLNVNFNYSDIIDTCWLWRGKKRKNYGVFRVDSGNKILAHIYIYTLCNGKYNPNYDIHHKCENKNCVNPRHLIALSGKAHRYVHSILKELFEVKNEREYYKYRIRKYEKRR